MGYKSIEDLRNRPYKKEVGLFQKRNFKKPISPLVYRFQMLEDEETGWGKNITQLMGLYRKQSDGTFCLDDIRKDDLTKIQKYPKTTFHVGPLTLSKPIEGLEEGQYCLFNWRFNFKEKVNPCEIEVDESKPIVFISPKDFVSAIEKAENTATDANNNSEKQTDVCILIYDLLHEANKYCCKSVDAQFYLTDKYISFQHTGRKLNAETLLHLCELGTSEEAEKDNNIAYHCQGLREFLLSNSNTIIVSNGFTVRFDNEGGKLKVAWVEKSDLPRDIKISLSRNKRFTESIIMPFEKNDNGTQNNYKVGLHCVFDDEQNIAFFSNIGKVSVKIKGGKVKTIDRKDWVVSKEYKTFIPKNIRLNQSDKKQTSIMFACLHKGKELLKEEDAPVYCLIPTTSSFGFSFLMQTDFLVNKTNYTINHRDPWNRAYAEIAGRLFAQWIADLAHKAEFAPKSIYGIVPKFEKCIEYHPEECLLIKLFQKGFKDVILHEKEEKTSTERKPVKSEKPSSNSKVYVIDTNIFVNYPNILSKMDSNDTVILSAKVIDELDNLKYKLEAKDLRNVQKALKNINVALDNGNVRMEMSDIRLLPRDFDRHNPDNNILSVVLRHKAESPTLLTSDNGLQIKAKAIGINVIGLKEFLAKSPKIRQQSH